MARTRSALVKLACWLLVAPGLAAQAQDVRVQVDHFVVTGNTLLPQDDLDAALARFTGRRTLAELQAAAAAVQALYRDAGFGSVVAYVPPQRGDPRRVTIAVREGRVSRVYVAGNRQFSDDNIRRAVPGLREGETPRVRVIDAQVALANENPARQISLALEPGPQPGDVEARITVAELPASRWSLALDNTGNAATGRLRASLGWQHAALWNLDHQASVQMQVAPEKVDAVAVVSAGYRVPLYGAGMALELFGARSDVDGGTATTQAGPLQFSGQGEVLGLRLHRLFERRGDVVQRASSGLDRRVYLNDCSILGLPPGACGAAGESVAVHPASIDYQWQSDGARPHGLRIGYSHNLDAGGRHAGPSDYAAVRPGAVRHYQLMRLGGFAALPLPGAFQLHARANAQWTGDALVPGEQFGIAGPNEVRGYEQREITGDSGVVAALELLTPDLQGDPATSLRLAGFADAGLAVNRLDTPCREGRSRCRLASLGLGVRVVHGAFQLRLDVAHALRDAVTTDRRDTRAHFQAIYGFH
jgi:hemolysin activation/secretion protein